MVSCHWVHFCITQYSLSIAQAPSKVKLSCCKVIMQVITADWINHSQFGWIFWTDPCSETSFTPFASHLELKYHAQWRLSYWMVAFSGRSEKLVCHALHLPYWWVAACAAQLWLSVKIPNNIPSVWTILNWKLEVSGYCVFLSASLV